MGQVLQELAFEAWLVVNFADGVDLVTGPLNELLRLAETGLS